MTSQNRELGHVGPPNANPPNQTEHDIICHMDVNIQDTYGRTDYDGHTYYFCLEACKRSFDEDPDGSLEREAAYNHDNSPGLMTDADDLPDDTLSEMGMKPNGSVALSNPAETETQREGTERTAQRGSTPSLEKTARGSTT